MHSGVYTRRFQTQIKEPTGHINSVMAHQDALEGEGEEDSGVCKAQDLHTSSSGHYITEKNGMKM